jgi:hypothetical protein
MQEVDEAAVVDSTGAFDAMLALHHLGDAVLLLQATATTDTVTSAGAAAATVDRSCSATATTAAIESGAALTTARNTAPAAVAAAFAALDGTSTVKGSSATRVSPSVTQVAHAWRISDLLSMLYTAPVSRFLKDRSVHVLESKP